MNNFGYMILPDGKYYSLDDFNTRLNNNVLVVGTTGAAKTRTVVTPNLLECVGSYIVTDPKGNLHRKWGQYMMDHGYRVIKVSFIHPENSAHYNPLRYINTTQQIQQLSSTLVYDKAVQSKNIDPFWDQNALMLLNAVIGYIKEMETVNAGCYGFNSITDLLRKCGRNMGKNSEFSTLMDRLKAINPLSWAYKQFQNVNQSPEKTFSTVVTTAIAKLSSLDTQELNCMMSYDDIDFSTIGQQKTAVFVEVSDSDRSMDRLINMFFTQAMNQLCSYADEKCENSMLPVPVRFFMDDFATNC